MRRTASGADDDVLEPGIDSRVRCRRGLNPRREAVDGPGADGADDMSLSAGVQRFNAAGELVDLYSITRFRFGNVAHGWLHVSRRELDEARSKPHQPTHLHLRDEPLKLGEIETWPSRSSVPASGFASP